MAKKKMKSSSSKSSRKVTSMQKPGAMRKSKPSGKADKKRTGMGSY